MTHPRRKIISDEQCIVVLDTSPVRSIAYESAMPAWVGTFADMSKGGYSFSLADGACIELLTQHARGSITDDELTRIVAATETYLNPEMPVLLGKVDLMRMIGESSAPTGWEADTLALSKQVWQRLKSASSTPPEKRISGEAELQEDRDDWIGAFAKFDLGLEEWLSEDPSREEQFPLHLYKHPLLDVQFRSIAARSVHQHPDMAERVDLQMRYQWRQWVRARQEKDGYNPASKRNRNDGVDLDMYRYLMLPALVVAGDSDFHKRISDINSPQLDWFCRPQELADAWTRGECPRPTWVAAVTEQAAS